MKFKNPTEEFVYKITKESFLSLWIYPSPKRGNDGKEICDILAIFGNEVAIFSVKDITLNSERIEDINRWKKRAIEKSVKQIYGAERWLLQGEKYLKNKFARILPLPNSSVINIHRISISLGSKGKTSIFSRDFGKGFVHIFDDNSFQKVITELDTPSDFFRYLKDKINFLSSSFQTILEGGEQDLLAYYLKNGRGFPEISGLLIVGEGLWDDLISREEYKSRQDENEDSKIWDTIIEVVSKDALSCNLINQIALSETEIALRQMASENRYQRRLLGKAFNEFLNESSKSIRSRLVISPSGIIYIFLATNIESPREDRKSELFERCLVARGKFREHEKIIGIATEQYQAEQGFSLDILYFSLPKWTDVEQELYNTIQSKENYFSGNLVKRFDQDEYPTQ